MKIEDREDVELFVRRQLDDKLSQCSPKQIAFFHRIFGPVVPKTKLGTALDLVERTIRKKGANDG